MSTPTDHDLDPYEPEGNEREMPGIWVVTLPACWSQADLPRRGDGYLIWCFDYNRALRYAAGDVGKVHRLVLETE